MRCKRSRFTERDCFEEDIFRTSLKLLILCITYLDGRSFARFCLGVYVPGGWWLLFYVVFWNRYTARYARYVSKESTYEDF